MTSLFSNTNPTNNPNTPISILLIKPSKYDDQGYVNHHFRGVLPSNTLWVLNALFHTSAQKLSLPVKIEVIDESVELVIPKKLMQSQAKNAPGVILVCLVGVQTNQFPRANDLAHQFRDLGALVVIGGFHVSGTIMLLGLTPELKALHKIGVSLFAGEAEGRVEDLLQDALTGELKPTYHPRNYPDLKQDWPIPLVDNKISRKFALSKAGTMDTSRGCIFRCSFCTVIQVQGNTMRSREPAMIEAHIRKNYSHLNYYFFTDDNMARNRNWREIFERLIKMRKEGLPIAFMMQVDTAAYRLPDFVSLAAQAGCQQVFVGIESLNQNNLNATAKKQNKVERFNEMICYWREAGVLVHAAYIIGFPFDTVASVRQDITHLIEVIKPDQVSFFMLTPLPGSVDHLELIKREECISSDLNEYDSFHATTSHPHMSKEEWCGVYREAWERFYSAENLIRVLKRANPRCYWQILKNASWYAYSVLCEGQHPMITGFWRLKGRTQRRSGFKIENPFLYFCQRVAENIKLGWKLFKLALLFERIWRKTWRHNHIKCWETNLEQRKHALQVVIEKLTWFSLHHISSARAWKRVKINFARHLPWNPKVWLETMRASIITPIDLCSRHWLFFLNYIFEV